MPTHLDWSRIGRAITGPGNLAAFRLFCRITWTSASNSATHRLPWNRRPYGRLNEYAAKIAGTNAAERLGFAGKSRIILSHRPAVAHLTSRYKKLYSLDHLASVKYDCRRLHKMRSV